MAKIYVSSTYLDLQEHRAQVEKVIKRMGHNDVAMEYYVAEDQRPVDKCLSDVEACDLYIGIFAWRYGWIPTKKNRKKISITEMEYRQAQKFNKPCLIFLLDGKAAWPPDFTDDDKTQIRKLRNELSEAHSTGPGFKSPDELRSLVAEAIHNWEKEQGLIQTTATIPEHNLTTYYNALRKRYNVLALEGLTPPQKEEYLQIQLRQVFVEQSVREDTPPVELPKEVWEKLSREQEIHEEDLPLGITLDDVRKARESYYQKPSRLVLDALTDSRNQYTIILGDPGSGKSTLARYVMLSLIDPLTADEKIQKVFEGYLPLLIELRTFAGLCAENKCETPLEFLEHLGKTEGWGLTETALHNHLKNDGHAVVIFDGLDEIFEPKLRETITNQIVGFTNAYPKARVIVTSRILGYRRKILSDAGFTHFTLQDLDEKQVEAFITKWYDLAMSDRLDEAIERSERILKSFKDSASIRQLAGNPMLLTIMAIIGKHQELPRERWKLYDHAASVLIQHWDVNKHLKDENLEADFIGEDDKKELLRRLAYRMQSGDGGLAGNYIHREGLQEEFESYLKERYSQTPDRAKVIAEAMIQQFRERNFILSLYGANVFGFVHRAFLEYFCASAFVWKFEKTKELTIEQLKTDVYGKHWKDQSWHEVLRLICGMLDEIWVAVIINYLVDDLYSSWPDNLQTFQSNPPWNIALAVQCMGETRNLNIIAESINKVLNSLCLLFDHLMNEGRWGLSDFISNNISPTLKYIGVTLPRNDILITWLRQRGAFSSSIPLAQSFGEFVGLLGGHMTEIKQLVFSYAIDQDDERRLVAPFAIANGWRTDPKSLETLFELTRQDSAWFVRDAAVLALAKYYGEDARTLPLLRERAVQDEEASVRRAAMTALAQYYREDGETLPLLRERAVQDSDSDVRSAAVSALVEHYREDAETLPLLREWVVKSEHFDVRRAAVSALPQYYREDGETLPLLRERAVQDENASVRSAAVSALVEHYCEDAETLPLLREWVVKSEHSDVRRAAVSALPQYYREDGETLPLLRERAVQDEGANVRSAAVSALAEHYREDAETLPLLREWVVKSEHSDVRSVAVSALAEHYREDGETLPLLRERAVQDEGANVRSAAVSALAEHYREDAQTSPLLRERAVQDEDADVRSAAVSALAEHYHEDAQTSPLLRERAVQDEDADVRRVAVSALAEHYREDAQTSPLLRERAVQDEDAGVRRVAVSALAKYYRKDAQTLLLLRERAVQDKGLQVRYAAVSALAEHYREDGETLPLLREWVVKSKHSDVRSVAVSALAEHYREDAQTLLFLRERAVDDESPKPDDEKKKSFQKFVRDTAIEAIAKYWSEHPDTLPLLRDRAEYDPTPWLRERCKELIAEIEGEKEK